MSLGADALPGWNRKTSPENEPDIPSGQNPNAAPPDAEDEPLTAPQTTTGGGKDNEPVVVWEADNRMEAQIVKGRLESEGIPAFLSGEALGTIYGFTTGNLAATDVLVPAPLASRALEILNTPPDLEEGWEDDWDEGWDEEIAPRDDERP